MMELLFISLLLVELSIAIIYLGWIHHQMRRRTSTNSFRLDRPAQSDSNLPVDDEDTHEWQKLDEDQAGDQIVTDSATDPINSAKNSAPLSCAEKYCRLREQFSGCWISCDACKLGTVAFCAKCLEGKPGLEGSNIHPQWYLDGCELLAELIIDCIRVMDGETLRQLMGEICLSSLPYIMAIVANRNVNYARSLPLVLCSNVHTQQAEGFRSLSQSLCAGAEVILSFQMMHSKSAGLYFIHAGSVSTQLVNDPRVDSSYVVPIFLIMFASQFDLCREAIELYQSDVNKYFSQRTPT